jgi:replication factor C small subunit
MVDIFDKNLDEKYKPKTRDEIFGQPHIKAKIDNWIAIGRIPHLLFVGPAGVGKTSTARAIARDLFGEGWQYNFHEYNASSTRGIDFIRNDIQTLVGVTPVGAAYHIIFLDEADELTKDAQTAMRQIMMKHTDTAKFILGCNYPHKIIQPIKDRCAVLRFGYLEPDVILRKLKIVCDTEGITYDAGVLELIANHSKGSLRKAIQNIEVYLDAKNHISMSLVEPDMQAMKDEDVRELLQKAFTGDIEGFETQLYRLHYNGGFCASELLEQIQSEIFRLHLEPEVKQTLIIQTAKYDWRISQGSNELLQMRSYLGTLQGIMNKVPSLPGYVD